MRRSKRVRTIALVAGATIALCAIAVFGVFGERVGGVLGQWRHSDPPPLASVVSKTATPALAAGQVEVPALSQTSLAQAKALLAAAGLAVSLKVDSALASSQERRVARQEPEAGSIVSAGATVTLVVPPASVTQARTSAKARDGRTFVVVIDPGNQSTADASPEPIGPGAAATTPSASRGAVGVSTGVPAYELNRQLAAELESRLVAAGMKVIMTRTTDDVDLSGSRRASIASAANADLYVQIEAQSCANPSAAGVGTLYPASNEWTKRTVGPSRRAAKVIQDNVVATCGAENRGTAQCSRVGFNWSAVPSVVIQTGFLSNPVEDKLLSSAQYQDRVSEGMANGIREFLSGGQ